MMKPTAAVAALSALAQETRLAIFRRLVTEGALGLPAGTLASELSVAPPNLTFHLHQLRQAGLLRARRRGRQVFYAIEVRAMRALLAFLVDDCCHGQPELCLPAPAAAACRPPARRPRRAVKAEAEPVP
jgi:DNA-binding transcriptional ArsR family regulator